MWGAEPQYVDMYLSRNGDFIQDIEITDPETNEAFEIPAGTRVYFRVGDSEWEGTVDGSTVRFKVEYEVTNEVRANTKVYLCISTPDGSEEADWVITQGRVVRG